MSKSKSKDDEKFELLDRLLELKLTIKQAEMESNWDLRQKLLDEMVEVKTSLERMK